MYKDNKKNNKASLSPSSCICWDYTIEKNVKFLYKYINFILFKLKIISVYTTIYFILYIYR